MKIIRIFIRKTNATPDDEDARINKTPALFDECDEVHISVTFTWDIARAEQLYKAWSVVSKNVKIGGPAFNERGGDFVSGLYLKKGYVITSRGCPNRCWFCSVPKREGYQLRELPIVKGNNILDDNLLACSEQHIQDVFAMLKKQRDVRFTGGLEARLLTAQRARELYELKPKTMFFAYDTPDDYEPLVQAGKHLREAGFKQSNHIARCYVLIGHKGDTFEKAEKRLRDAWSAGFMPFAMLYRDKTGNYNVEWRRFQREWANQYIVGSKLKIKTIK
jgi:hypothetical protein